MDSQLMTLPFTFMNFAFGANNKIVNVLRDPNRLHNAQGVIALLGMSYLSLEMKDKSWWRGADSVETVARVVAQHHHPYRQNTSIQILTKGLVTLLLSHLVRLLAWRRICTALPENTAMATTLQQVRICFIRCHL